MTLFSGEVLADGTLKGEIAGKSYRTAIEGRRKADAAKSTEQPPDPFTLTTVKDPNEPFRFSGLDTSVGKTVASTDARFQRKAVSRHLRDVCPTATTRRRCCKTSIANTTTRGSRSSRSRTSTVTMDRVTRARSTSSARNTGLAFQSSTPGTTADGQIAATLPQLVGFGAYPTTIFIGRDGKVRKIHAGFNGPATGAHFDETKTEMDQLTREILK